MIKRQNIRVDSSDGEAGRAGEDASRGDNGGDNGDGEICDSDSFGNIEDGEVSGGDDSGEGDGGDGKSGSDGTGDRETGDGDTGDAEDTDGEGGDNCCLILLVKVITKMVGTGWVAMLVKVMIPLVVVITKGMADQSVVIAADRHAIAVI